MTPRGNDAGRRAAWSAVALTAIALVLAGGCSGGGDGGSGSGGAGRTGPGSPTTAPSEAAPVPSKGCRAAATPKVQVQERTLEVRGEQRRYLVTAPAQAKGGKPLPLVLDIHGLSEGADVHAKMTRMGELGLAEGFITVFPHGTGNPVAWRVGIDRATNPDLEYMATVLDQVEAARCVDTSRVYATGLSNGAMMASTLGCAMADRIAAIAPVSGIDVNPKCTPARRLPVMTFHGTADPILLFNGGVDGSALSKALSGGGGGGPTTTTKPADLNGPGYPATVRRWAELDGCKPTPRDTTVSDEVIKRTYDCPATSPVVFYIVKGGGHAWPGSPFSAAIERIVGRTTMDVDATKEIWRFFSGFSLPKT